MSFSFLSLSSANKYSERRNNLAQITSERDGERVMSECNKAKVRRIEIPQAAISGRCGGGGGGRIDVWKRR
jgi:hypothetical protein